MIGLFKKKTAEDLLIELRSKKFNENKVSKMLETIDVNTKDSNNQNFLHKIIPDNNIESVKALIKNKIEINALDINEKTPLLVASQYGYLDAIEALLNSGADANIRTNCGHSPLYEAILANKYNAYFMLKKHTTNLNQINSKGMSLVNLAIKVKNVQILNDLLSSDNIEVSNEILFNKDVYNNKDIYNIVIKYFGKDLNVLDDENKNILFYIVENGIEAVDAYKEAIKNNVDINCISASGDNILLHLIKESLRITDENIDEVEGMTLNQAIADKQKRIKNLASLIEYIVNDGVDTKICNNDDENALTLAVETLSTDVLEKLLYAEISPNELTLNKRSALYIAAMKGPNAHGVLNLLLDYGASPDIEDPDGKTIIEKLIDIELSKNNGKKLDFSQRQAIVPKHDYYFILEGILANSEVNLRKLNSNKDPYLFEPIYYGNLAIAKLLIAYGADINQTSNEDLNILYKYINNHKSFKKDSEIKDFNNNLKNIISMGANVNAKDSFGGIVLHKAILDCDIQTVKIILHSGADINAIDNRGRNMVHNCVWKSKMNIFRLIYSYNKKLINQPDKFGVIPINYAAFLGYTDMVLELIRTGSHMNNPIKKTNYILNFLKKFHKNVKPLLDAARSGADKTKVYKLLENMQLEFDIKKENFPLKP